MQEIYSLIAERPVKFEETYIKTVNGKEVEAKRKKTKKEKTNLVFVKPSASMLEEAEFFFGQQYNKFINAGFMTRAMMAKKFGDVGGLGAEHDDGLKEHLADYMEASQKIEFYGGAKNLTDEQKEVLRKAEETVGLATKFISEYQSNMNSVYSQTAETRADQKMVEWFFVNFLFIKEKVEDEEEYFPFFDGHGFAEKREFYMDLQDEVENPTPDFIKKQDLLAQNFEQFIRAITLWRGGYGSNTKEINEQINELFTDPE